MPASPPDPLADLTALRRRLYAPDATEQDMERYTAALALLPAPEPEPEPVPVGVEDDRPPAEPPPAPAPSPAPHRRALLFVGVVVALAAAVVAVLAITSRSSPPQSATPSAEPTAVALSIPSSATAEFARALQQGEGADLAGYIFEHPESRPPDLRTLTRAATEEHSGTGGTTVSLEPSTEANAGGHLTVILTLGTRTTATWRAARVALDRIQRVAAATTTQPAGVPFSLATPYTGRAPTLLSISAPRGTRWDALVVFSN